MLGGLAGCVCIATGFVFFVEKRKRAARAAGVSGARWVDALAVDHGHRHGGRRAGDAASPTGCCRTDLPHAATGKKGAFWVRLAAGAARMRCWRSAPVQQARIAPAWREQCWAIAALALAAVLLNWITHRRSPAGTPSARGYWPVAGLDLALIVAATVAIVAGRALRRRERGASQEVAVRDAPLEVSGAGNV